MVHFYIYLQIRMLYSNIIIEMIMFYLRKSVPQYTPSTIPNNVRQLHHWAHHLELFFSISIIELTAPSQLALASRLEHMQERVKYCLRRTISNEIPVKRQLYLNLVRSKLCYCLLLSVTVCYCCQLWIPHILSAWNECKEDQLNTFYKTMIQTTKHVYPS